MSLKAILFDFNGVIINDEPIHEQLLAELLIQENLRPKDGEFRELCLGRSDRACILELFARRGRILEEPELTKLIQRKAQAYQAHIETLAKIPVYPGLEDLIYQIRGLGLKMAVVSGALRSEVELVLNRLKIAEYFSAIVSGDDIKVSKPEPDGYLLAIERLNRVYPGLNLQPQNCLAIEDTFPGIESAKRAKIPVVGVAHAYPLHMLQRHANWAVDYLWDLNLERVQEVYSQSAA
ncbi:MULTISPECIES: HAD family hydrolase [Planktothricoides]|uniref:HAD family phosphatase n=2 Tax=Planktothricoides raciborskii TaxID=132608 RepID=A0AAU8JI37_9CYAN|nr:MULTISPECIES: HAD family phosphatase [Planktothricoides]KOR35290.1 HAD family hydrolase [Planktothricoides sp. SR001]MBD2543757.1 HAD family phosphatase [Planktothricoides raciborskii FACHB-1370]MBD2582348.1 HAD family phosphatase [Planktothricoides raciborskii FACHB-1261]